MGEVEKQLVANFLYSLNRYLPEADGYYWLRNVPVGGNAETKWDSAGMNKWIDLLLVEPTFGSGWIHDLDTALRNGLEFAGRYTNIRSSLKRLNGEGAWIVEAKDSKNKLWEALGQAVFYRALFKLDYNPHLWIKGSAVIYPVYEGRDRIVESAVQIFKEELHLELRVIPVEIRYSRKDAQESRRSGGARIDDY